MAIAVELISGGSAMRIVIIKWILMITVVCQVITSLIPISGSYGSSHLKLLLVILEPQAWEGAMQFLTHEPVLFALVNLVILLIWISSRADCDAVNPNPIVKEEKLSSVWNNTAELQRGQILDSIQKQHMTTTHILAAASTPQTAAAHIKAQSKEVPHISSSSSIFNSSSKSAPHLKSISNVDCSSPSFRAAASKNIHMISKCGSESKLGAIAPVEMKRSFSLDSNGSVSPDSVSQTSKKSASVLQIAKDKKDFNAVSPYPVAVTTNRTKFDKRSDEQESVRRCSRPAAAVIEEDELNERIEAFFSKFRERMRKESICSQQKLRCSHKPNLHLL